MRVSDTVSDLEARRARLVDKYDSVIASWAAHSTGDRSYSNWAPDQIRREIDEVDRKLAALQAPSSSGRTVQRLRRAR